MMPVIADDRVDLSTARVIADDICNRLSSYTTEIRVCGSIRRGRDTVKDVELCAYGTQAILDATDRMVADGTITKAEYGKTRTHRWGDKYRGFMWQGMKVELFLFDECNRGYVYWLRTGPGECNTIVMTALKQAGYPVRAKDGYIWHGDRKLKIRDEIAMFALLGMPALRPSERVPDTYRRLLQSPHTWGDPTPYYINDTPATVDTVFAVADVQPRRRQTPVDNRRWNAMMEYMRTWHLQQYPPAHVIRNRIDRLTYQARYALPAKCGG